MLFHLILVYNFEKEAPKIPDFNTNQNFDFNVASSIEGFVRGKSDFLIILNSNKNLHCISLAMLFISHIWSFAKIITLLSFQCMFK